MNNYNRVYAKIDLDAIHNNLYAIQALLSPSARIVAVVKADGYGHGAVPIACSIQDEDCLAGFAVATAEEALELRENGITKPILILGCVFAEHYPMLIAQKIRPTVFTLETAMQLSQAAREQQRKIPVHIKIDTGMSRIGMPADAASIELIRQIASLPQIVTEGMFTHFARADETDKTAALDQLSQFEYMIRLTKQAGVHIPYCHCSNSAAIIDLPQANMDLVRAGIILYGLWPSDEVQKDRICLQPVLELVSHVAYVKQLEAGKSVSYGGTYTATEPKKIATIPVGNGDGYPRSLSNKGCVLIHGKRAPVVGRICMDQFMVDVTQIPDVKTGDRAVLAGTDGTQTLTLEELGDLSGRFNYEFACGLSKRIPRVFYKNGIRI